MKLSSNSRITDPEEESQALRIVTHVRPPKRRNSGKSLIPFRPYVKYLSSVRQRFSYTNGIDPWKINGTDEIFFEQPNARCIGTLIDDCETSDIIRWDIPSESTHLPMMCKLWIITDGAVVERGKPHLVQDLAVQVFTGGRQLRSILSNEHRINQIYNERKLNRRRLQSWHEINEYHSVPYFQYTRPVRSGVDQSIECHFDEILEQVTGNDLSTMKEEFVENVQVELGSTHASQHSMTTQTECSKFNQTTSTDSQLVRIFNLNLEQNEVLLSSIVNPYRSVQQSDISNNLYSYLFNDKEHQDRSVSTGDDYPRCWNQLETGFILSDRNSGQIEEKPEQMTPSLSSPRHEQSIQTEFDQIFRSARPTTVSSSSNSRLDELTVGKHQKFADFSEQNNSEYLSDDKRSTYLSNYRRPNPRPSECCDTGYERRCCSLNKELDRCSSSSKLNSNVQVNVKSRGSRNVCNSSSDGLLSDLVERYERTLQERERTFAIINNQLLDVEDVLGKYTNQFDSNPAANSSNDRSNQISSEDIQIGRTSSMDQSQSKEELIRVNALLSKHLIEKYRMMPGISSQQMIQGYIPSTRVSLILSPQERQLSSTETLISRPSTRYCDLCVNDRSTTGSAWIRYNERRIEDLQKRIDLMLKIDDQEEAKLLLTPTDSTRVEKNKLVQQRIDELITGKYRSGLDRISSDLKRTSRTSPIRTNQSMPTTPRSTRPNTRSTTPSQKSVRILSPTQTLATSTTRQSKSPSSRSINSILRRTDLSQAPRRSTDQTPKPPTSHVWKSKVDGQVYVLDQFSIPRYYRLYNDASFREIYNASRVLDNCLTNKQDNIESYSSFVRSFALEQPLK